MSDQRALLDECTNRPTCTAAMHLSDCPSAPQLRLLGALQRSVDAARAERRMCEPPPQLAPAEDLQQWERCVPGSDVAIERLVVAVGDGDGTARVPQHVLAQLLVDAGWERTS